MKTLDELDALHAEDAERIREELRTTGRHYTEPHEYLHDAWPTVSARLRAAEAEVERLRGALRNVRDNYDCDESAHKYGTTCRCCDARAALGEP